MLQESHQPELEINIELFNTSLLRFLKSGDTTNLAAQMSRVLDFCEKATMDATLTYSLKKEVDDAFFADLNILTNVKRGSQFKAVNISRKIEERYSHLKYLINHSYLPEDIKKQFFATLNVRNEKEYYRQVALITGAAIVFAFAPICFAFAATGHALYAVAAAMVGIGLALIAATKITNKATTTWYFNTFNGPKWDAKEFKQWVGNLDTLVTKSMTQLEKSYPKTRPEMS